MALHQFVFAAAVSSRYWSLSNFYFQNKQLNTSQTVMCGQRCFVHQTFIVLNTVSPNKHGNSVTIFILSTSAQLGCKIKVWRGCVPANQAQVDQFDIVTVFPCLLGHTVLSDFMYVYFICWLLNLVIKDSKIMQQVNKIRLFNYVTTCVSLIITYKFF